MSSLEQILLATLQNPPDRNEPLPPANRPATIYGVAISFLIVSWIAVVFRLWVRVKVVRNPGWDDAFILFVAVANAVGRVWVCKSVQHGLGQHMIYIGLPNLEKYLFYFYLENGFYLTQTTLIKISLLLQFLRIFKAGVMRWICISLLVLVSLWGLGFSFIGWFPCFPVRGAWQRNINAKCYGYGLGDLNEFITIFKAHAASNMVLDIAIFLTPLVIFRTPNLKAKHLLAMAGLFAFGAVAVSTSIWRLYAIISTQAATYPYIDFTWRAPILIILSCLELDLAITCASIPIFWPIVEQSLSAIFVSYEVKITEERVREDYGLAYELEHTKGERHGSMRSTSGTSVEGLTRESGNGTIPPQYSVGVDPLDEEARMRVGPQAVIQTKPKPKWEI